MKNLAEEQGKMRERMKAKRPPKDATLRVASEKEKDLSELESLRKQVKTLQADNQSLRCEIAALQRQSREPQTLSWDDERRKQQHDFFKYSNARNRY